MALRRLAVFGSLLLGLVALGEVASRAQQPAALQQDPGRIVFQVVQSFDARHEADTPGHTGRAQGLTTQQPGVALGDAVYRAGEQVGVVTGLGWSPAHGTLEVEFRPAANVRVAVGDSVWLAARGQAAR